MGDHDQAAARADLGHQQRGHVVAPTGVEALGRLVRHHDPRAPRPRRGDGDALGHAAGEFVGQLRLRPLQAQRGEVGPGAGLRLGAGQAAHQAVGLGHLARGAHQRVERQPRLLRQHRDLAPPQATEIPRPGGVEAAARDLDPAPGREPRRQRAHQRLGEQALARAGLAQDHQRLAGVDDDRQRGDQPLGAVEDGEIGCAQQAHGSRLPASRVRPSSRTKVATTGASRAWGASCQ